MWGGGDRKQKETKAPRLLLFPCPFQGHINPMFQLAAALYSRGFSITIIHPKYGSPNPAKHPHYRFEAISDGIERQPTTFEESIALLIALNTNCKAPLRDCVARLLSESRITGEPVTCIINDSLMYFTKEVSDTLKLPRFVLRTGSFTSLLAFHDSILIPANNHIRATDSTCEASGVVSELLEMKRRDYPTFPRANQDHINVLLEGMIKSMKGSLGVIWNTFEELEPLALSKIRELIGVTIYPVGPLHMYSPNASSSMLEQDISCISWLDKQAPRSVIYVSFGSIVMISKNELVEVAWGLANSKQPFIWVVRPGLLTGLEEIKLPEGFLEEVKDMGKIVSWAPQQEILAHPSVGGFWTHCGWNSTLEAICEGVPMLCLPNFGDQPVNARHASYIWKVAIQLENGLDRKEIEKAVKRLIVEEEGSEMRKRIKVLKENAERCIREGGSSKMYLAQLVDSLQLLNLEENSN